MVRKLLAFLFLALPLVATGCICHPTKLNVTIELDETMRSQLADRKIQVDIVGLNANEHARWESYSMTKYWEPNDPRRDSVPTYHVVFDPTKPGAQTLSMSDPIWDKWPIREKKDISDKDMPRLYVLAQLPGIWGPSDDQPGEKDPRRQILPLGDCRWKTKDIQMKIQKTGIITITQQVRDNKNQ